MVDELELLLAEMREMAALYQRLDEAAGQAAALLVKGDASGLHEAVAMQEQLLNRARQVGASTQRRREIIGESLHSHTAYSELNAHLRQAARRLRRSGRLNLALAQSALSFIRYSVRVLADQPSLTYEAAVPASRRG